MRWRNHQNGYGLIAIALHWSIAVLVITLFALGLWMTGLDYYDPWYRRAPDLHRGFGILAGLLVCLRLIWRMVDRRPGVVPGRSAIEKALSSQAHRLLAVWPLLLVVSGYLISTADGRALSVFGWFQIPALVTGIDNLEDLAGDIHLALAIGLMALAAIHAGAAFKHQFIGRDGTLMRMLRPHDHH
jgi:cytochrome b561